MHIEFQVSRRTIARWHHWLLVDKYKPFAFRLKSKVPWLGRAVDSAAFWSACLGEINLSSAMLFINNLGDIIP